MTLYGILTGIQRRRNRDGKLWASMQLEDLQGSIDALVFKTNFERVEPLLIEDQVVMNKGSVLPEENAPPKISVLDVVPLDVARVALPSLISIRVWLSQDGGSGSDLLSGMRSHSIARMTVPADHLMSPVSPLLCFPVW